MKLGRATALLVFSAPLVFAQAQYGSIGGTVTDTTRAVIPAVAITIVNAETGQSTAGVSGADGHYLVPQLLPGTYGIRVEHGNFKRLQVSGIKVDINQSILQDLTLEVGSVTESVAVSARAQLLETVTGSVGHVVDNKEILELPLNGRNVFDLVSLTPGAFRLGGEVSISGGRTSSAMALLDGVFNSRGGIGAQNIEMNP